MKKVPGTFFKIRVGFLSVCAVASVVACVFACMFALAGCASQGIDATGSLQDYQRSDMSGYACSEGYEGEYRYVDMTVREILSEMDSGTSFVLFAGFAKCPWCNVVLNPLNDVATEKGILIGYLDTRRNPSWKSNADVDDFDLFAERFEEFLDNEGEKPHLYVPEVFYIKDGQLTECHTGTIPDQESPEDPLSEEQLDDLRQTLAAPLR